MNVFVVLADAMRVVQYCGVFALKDQAEAHLGKGVFGRNPRVIECQVVGSQPDPKIVYVAQVLVRAEDAHDFEGVYGNFECAKQASGPQGATLTVSI